MRILDIISGLEWWTPSLMHTVGSFPPNVTARCPPFILRAERLILLKPSTFMNLSGKAVTVLDGFRKNPCGKNPRNRR